jgi:hypothetical protein
MTKPFELYSETHGPVVGVMENPWDEGEIGFKAPLIVTADGTLWQYRGGAWEGFSWSIVESLNGRLKEFQDRLTKLELPEGA